MRLTNVLLVVTIARAAAAQTPADTARVSGATVSGVVRDSIRRAPLAGATVQLVAADNLARYGRLGISDSLGRFSLGNVPDGHYMLGFFHPMLDSLGLEPPLREVHVDGQRAVRADLGIPSPARLRAAICGRGTSPDEGAVLVGIVRNAQNGAPAAGVSVAAEWMEIDFGARSITRRTPHIVATTLENGWFAMCNVPSAGTMFVMASRGADSTGVIEVRIPQDGFLRRELFLRSGGGDVSSDPASRRGRLAGVVVAAQDGRPLAGASVGIEGGAQARANDLGEWSLATLPVGTQMLDVRAFGFYPERRRVDVVEGAARVHVALSTLRAVLDTVRVTARGRNDEGFESRRRTGAGRYLTAGDIAARQPREVSELFRTMPGVKLEYDQNGVDKWIRMPGAFGACSPAIYLNGVNLGDRLSADDIDAWARPNDITGIEIYSEASAPMQYHVGEHGRTDSISCGTILFWTR